jgi:hypothetical protein
VFAEGEEASAGVVAAYFPDLPVMGPRPVAGADVAIVVPRSYQPVPPSDQTPTECPAVPG